MLGRLSVPGRPTYLYNSRAKAVGASGGCLYIFLSSSFSFFLSPSLGDGPIQTKIVSQRAVKPKQPTNQRLPCIYKQL